MPEAKKGLLCFFRRQLAAAGCRRAERLSSSSVRPRSTTPLEVPTGKGHSLRVSRVVLRLCPQPPAPSCSALLTAKNPNHRTNSSNNRVEVCCVFLVCDPGSAFTRVLSFAFWLFSESAKVSPTAASYCASAASLSWLGILLPIHFFFFPHPVAFFFFFFQTTAAQAQRFNTLTFITLLIELMYLGLYAT